MKLSLQPEQISALDVAIAYQAAQYKQAQQYQQDDVWEIYLESDPYIFSKRVTKS